MRTSRTEDFEAWSETIIDTTAQKKSTLAEARVLLGSHLCRRGRGLTYPLLRGGNPHDGGVPSSEGVALLLQVRSPRLILSGRAT